MEREPTARHKEDETFADSTHAGGVRGSSGRADEPTTRHDPPARQDDSPARLDDPAPGDFNIFKQPWLVVACLLLAVSVTLLLLSHADAAFVCAALGVSAWFWNVREGLRRKHNLVRLSGRNWVQRGDEEDED